MYQVKSQQRDRNGLGNPNLSSLEFHNFIREVLKVEPNDLPSTTIHKKFCKSVITDMREKHFDLLGEIVIFPEEACTVKHKKELLFKFINEFSEFGGREFREIWMNFAYSCFINKMKVRIKDYSESDSKKAQTNMPHYMSYFTTSGNNLNEQYSISLPVNSNGYQEFFREANREFFREFFLQKISHQSPRNISLQSRCQSI